MRSPLAAVETYLDTLLEGFAGDLTPEQRAILERCSQRVQALVNLVDDLLDMSRLESGRVERQIAALDVAQVAGEVLDLLRPTAEKRGVSLYADLPAGLPAVEMDREDLVRILTNLLGNAIKYNRPQGNVTLRARDEGYYLRLEVEDTGLGIPREALPQLFSEFFRVKRPETQHITGTGLGLAIVKDLVERYKGRISVRSKLGEGTTFTVVLPLAG